MGSGKGEGNRIPAKKAEWRLLGRGREPARRAENRQGWKWKENERKSIVI